MRWGWYGGGSFIMRSLFSPFPEEDPWKEARGSQEEFLARSLPSYQNLLRFYGNLSSCVSISNHTYSETDFLCLGKVSSKLF